MFRNSDLIEQTDTLRKFAYRLTGNACDAEDLVQSTVLRALEKKHLFQEDSNLCGWTSKIMFNLFVSGYRRKVKFETQYDPESYIERESVEASQELKMELEDVRDAMEELSDDHREILEMICIKGMQYAEVSELLQIPVGTVRSRLSRARENLMSIMETPKTKTPFLPVQLPHHQPTHMAA